MKRLFTILSFIFLFAGLYAQVDKENVAVEIGTGTWCYYCPGAAMGADDMIANGLDVAIIENHNGDSYANTYSNARNSYYNITGYPTAFFDGVLSVVGGNHTQSMYPNYLQKYNQRINIPSDFTIDFEGSTSGFVDFEVVFDIEKVNGDYGSLRFHVAITESEIAENWQGMNVLNFVNRVMVPNQNGTTLDFSSTSSHEVTVNFSIDPSWVNEHCEMVAFIQNNQSREVYQAVKMNVMELGSNLTYDAAFGNVYVTKTICMETVSPVLELYNYGQETLTSLTIEYYMNGSDPATFEWSGSLPQDEYEMVELPAIPFEMQADNILTIVGSNPNGHEDEYPPNNTIEQVILEAENVSSPVHLQLKLDNHPDETTWEVINSIGEVVYSGGPYSQSGATINEDFDLQNNDCYTFIIYDASGDGIFSPGQYMIYDDTFTLMEVGNDFGSQDELQFGVGLTAIEELNEHFSMDVFPNPFSDHINIEYNINESTIVSITLMNSLGEVVYYENSYRQQGNNRIALNSGDFAEGVYYLVLDINGSKLQEKVMLVK